MQYTLDAKEREIANKILSYNLLKGMDIPGAALFWAVKLAAMVDPNDSRAESLYKVLGHCLSCEARANELLKMYHSSELWKNAENVYEYYAIDAKFSASQAAEIVAEIVASHGVSIDSNVFVSQGDLGAHPTEDVLKTAYTAVYAVLTARVNPIGL
jgi:hypothetical protein